MASRLIRDGILDSTRYWSVTIEARQLFWHLMLLADDYGCCSAAIVFIKRRAFETPPANAHVEMLLQQLADADLIRLYAVDKSPLLFIPRFGQRLRRMHSKYALPPLSIMDDSLKQKLKEKSDGNPPQSADSPPPHVSKSPPELELELEGKGREGNLNLNSGRPVDKSNGIGRHRRTSKPDEKIQGKTVAEWVSELGINVPPAWSYAETALAVERELEAKGKTAVHPAAASQ